MLIYTYDYSFTKIVYIAIILFLCILEVYLIIGAIKRERDKAIFVSIVLGLITLCAWVCLLPDLIEMSKWDKCIKEKTYKTVEGVAVLHQTEEDYYRDEFKGYLLDFTIAEVDFIDMNQTFSADVQKAIEAGERLKVFYYQEDKDIIVLQIYIIE